MYANEKILPFETLLGMVGLGIKESDGGGEFNYDILSQCTPPKQQ
jgi:hypothetical protein